jgi:2-oxoglutarate ferredoxin oxidoreductase subunit alpha
MKAQRKKIKPGNHRLSGSQACVEGAFAAGCRFLAGYPIEPSIEIMDWFLARAPETSATFVQMEDEISALAALIGAVWTGKKGITPTSGPGFSLMMEHVGLAVMLETPCVIVNVQRAGLSTGLPSRPGQGDVMQARWGSHGDYELIALAPSSSQEMFDFTIKAFNLSERYRVPVVILSDEHVAHAKEQVRIPSADKIKLTPRKYFKGAKNKYLPFKRDRHFIPAMVDIGQDYRFHVTGLTHDDRGYPVMDDICQEYNVHPLVWKIRNYVDKIIDIEEEKTRDAEVVVVSYGATAKFAPRAVDKAREAGIKTGSLKLNTIWPFPDKRMAKLAGKIKAFVVPEMNFGQIVYEVQRAVHGATNVVFVPYGEKGAEDTSGLVSAIKKAAAEKDKKNQIIEYR